jgi:hypothetical protein
MQRMERVRRLGAMAVVTSAALAGAVRGAEDKRPEVGIFAGLSLPVQERLKSCGFDKDAVPKIVENELLQQGFRVVPLDQNPGGGEVRVEIMLAERKDGLAAWSVQLSLRERARLERAPSRLVPALSWDNEKYLTIGKASSLCRDVDKKLRASVRRLAADRPRESASNR